MTRSQLFAITGTIVLFILLFIADKRLHSKEKEVVNNDPSFANMIVDQKKDLDKQQLAEVEKLETSLKAATNKEKKLSLEELIVFWDHLQKPWIAAYYAEQLALLQPDDQNWYKAGVRFYKSVGFASPESKTLILEKAISCLNKSLELNSTNVDAKVKLGSSIVEGTNEPMKGIKILKEVVDSHPDNKEAHLTLGFFAIKSNQLDKALERFNKVLEIDPTYIEAYLFLADVYKSKGDTAKAIEALTKYKEKIDDPSIKEEVQKYIQQLH